MLNKCLTACHYSKVLEISILMCIFLYKSRNEIGEARWGVGLYLYWDCLQIKTFQDSWQSSEEWENSVQS